MSSGISSVSVDEDDEFDWEGLESDSMSITKSECVESELPDIATASEPTAVSS